MPMAGEGSRFLKEGWTTPKPLIELNGQPLFKHAISSVTDKDIQMKYSFIVRQEHIDKYQIDKGIRSFLPEANLFSIFCCKINPHNSRVSIKFPQNASASRKNMPDFTSGIA